MRDATTLYDAQCEKVRSHLASGGGNKTRLARIETLLRRELLQIDRIHRRRTAEALKTHQSDWESMSGRWRQGLSEVTASVAEIREAVERQNPSWYDRAWDGWSPPRELPSVVRFGEVRVATDAIHRGRPRDERLAAGVPSEWVWPALLHFPDRANLLIEVPEEEARGRRGAASVGRHAAPHQRAPGVSRC